MGIVKIEKLYTGHTDLGVECMGYNVELCCDCCGRTCHVDDLYERGDGDMYCYACILADEKTYDSEKNPVYYGDGRTVIDCCQSCGCGGSLYEVEVDGERIVYCGSCLLDEMHEQVEDKAIEEALESYFDRA